MRIGCIFFNKISIKIRDVTYPLDIRESKVDCGISVIQANTLSLSKEENEFFLTFQFYPIASSNNTVSHIK